MKNLLNLHIVYQTVIKIHILVEKAVSYSSQSEDVFVLNLKSSTSLQPQQVKNNW